jgi:hypothetical protein
MSNTLTQKSPEKLEAKALQLTTDQIKELWRLRILTASGYLYLLLQALGPITVQSNEQFCKEWGLTLKTFYKARNRLLEAGIEVRVEKKAPTFIVKGVE